MPLASLASASRSSSVNGKRFIGVHSGRSSIALTLAESQTLNAGAFLLATFFFMDELKAQACESGWPLNVRAAATFVLSAAAARTR